ncbi:hypothetical protein WDW86_06430 [Bdellovibrionota bacterium FG-2]
MKRLRSHGRIILFTAFVAVRSPATTQHFLVQVSDDRLVHATLNLPSGLLPGQRVPVLMVFGGFEGAGRVLDLIHTEKPIALASFDYPFSQSRNLKFPGVLQALPEAKQLFPATVQGILDLAKSLRSRPEIDPHRIFALGASFGSPFVLAAAAKDADISAVILVHAFGQVPETAEHVLLRSWLPRYGWISRPAAWFLSRLFWLYLGIESPETDAQKLNDKQRVFMITASQDSFIPQSSSNSLWLALQQSPAHVTRKVMITDHLMPGSEKLIDEIIHEVETWIDQTKSTQSTTNSLTE